MARGVARRSIALAQENGIVLVSAGVAFYLFNSLIPLLVFLIIGITAFGWMESLLTLLAPAIGSDADSLISVMDTVIGEGAGRGRAALLAAGILAWSSFTMFQSVNRAFGHIYGVQAERSTIEATIDTGVVLITVVVAIAVLLGGHIVLTALMGGRAATLASVPLLGLVLFGVLLPMFYLFPPSTVTVREVLPGAVFTGVSWTVCALGFRLYLATSDSVQLYGIAGGVMLLLTWLYVGSLTLLFGIIINVVLAGRAEASERWSGEE